MSVRKNKWQCIILQKTLQKASCKDEGRKLRENNEFWVNAPNFLSNIHHHGSGLPVKEVSKLACSLETQITLSCLKHEL